MGLITLTGLATAAKVAAPYVVGALGMASGGMSSALSYRQAQQLQASQNQWMEKMSNTAHQREVADLKAAGLNPILSASGGSGASTPQAGSAGQNPVDLDPTSAYMAYKNFMNQQEATKSQISLNKTQEELNNANAYQANSAGALSVVNRQLAEKYSPLMYEADLALRNAQTAREIQGMKNDILMTNSNMDLNSAYSWYYRHRALGFSESKSSSDSHSSDRKLGVHVHGVDNSSGFSDSFNRSYSRSW